MIVSLFSFFVRKPRLRKTEAAFSTLNGNKSVINLKRHYQSQLEF